MTGELVDSIELQVTLRRVALEGLRDPAVQLRLIGKKVFEERGHAIINVLEVGQSRGIMTVVIARVGGARDGSHC